VRPELGALTLVRTVVDDVVDGELPHHATLFTPSTNRRHFCVTIPLM
jgi:hypothetical protein